MFRLIATLMLMFTFAAEAHPASEAVKRAHVGRGEHRALGPGAAAAGDCV